MIAREKHQTATTKDRDSLSTLSFRTGKDDRGSAGMQTRSAQDDYDRKVSLFHRAFNEISKLVFECDYTLTADDWRALDEARLDDPALSYAEARERLVQVYRRIKRACIESGRWRGGSSGEMVTSGARAARPRAKVQEPA